MKKSIVLIHGWGTRSYNRSLIGRDINEGVAWEQRQKLIDGLKEKYQVEFCNLPGFCGVAEPNKQAFDLEDFSDYLASWLKEKQIMPRAIVGYSFGGAVTLDYKMRYKVSTPIVLISPALKRSESWKSKLGELGKLTVPGPLVKTLKLIYQYLFSNYYRKGSDFLRASYDKIVRRDIRGWLNQVSPRELLLIYGDKDQSTPVELVTDVIKDRDLRCVLIKGGDHDIGQTHPKEIENKIRSFI